MATINTYLNFDGKAEEAFDFYKSIFGGEFTALMRMRDTPDGNTLPFDEQNRIMHVSLPIGNHAVLMASDILPSAGHELREGNNYYVAVTVDSRAEADRLFDGLAEGGNAEMPMQEVFWGSYFGMLTDKFGINWMIDHELKS